MHLPEKRLIHSDNGRPSEIASFFLFIIFRCRSDSVSTTPLSSFLRELLFCIIESEETRGELNGLTSESSRQNQSLPHVPVPQVVYKTCLAESARNERAFVFLSPNKESVLSLFSQVLVSAAFLSTVSAVSLGK